jgi:hypothetical protein
MSFHRSRQLSRKEFATRTETGIRNHQDKEELLVRGARTGLLFMPGAEPVGWVNDAEAVQLAMRRITEGQAK